MKEEEDEEEREEREGGRGEGVLWEGVMVRTLLVLFVR